MRLCRAPLGLGRDLARFSRGMLVLLPLGNRHRSQEAAVKHAKGNLNTQSMQSLISLSSRSCQEELAGNLPFGHIRGKGIFYTKVPSEEDRGLG